MDGEFRFGVILILIAAVLILILLIDAWFRERRKKIKEELQEPIVIHHPPETKTTVQYILDDLIIIHVIAKQGGHFASYDLLQAISATGMQYGAMNIFHYYLDTSNDKISLFNLASATEPGEFDLNQMGDFSCAGLTLFMNMRQVPDAMEAFEAMLHTAEQLADDLQGDIYTAHQAPWSDEILLQHHEKIINYQRIV